MPSVVVNGASTTADAGTLCELVRARSMKAASHACGDGTCGACRVLVDGVAVNSCMIQISSMRDGAVVETYEAIASEPAASRVLEAFERERPTRCHLCTGGLGVTAVSIARARERGEAASIDAAIGEATCMCTGRGSWRRALSVL